MDFAWLEARHLKTGEKTFLIVSPRPQIVGRSSSGDDADKLVVAIDASLSRNHFEISLQGDKLQVRRCPEARRPLFFVGRAEDQFEVHLGEAFSSGQTLFSYVRETAPAGHPVPVDPTLLSVAQEQDASRGLRALLALQPLLRDFDSPVALIRGTLSVLGEVLPSAADLIALQVDETGGMRVIASQGNSNLPPSRTLVSQALEQRRPVCYFWPAGSPTSGPSPTLVEGVSWAVAAPILVQHETFVLYALGSEGEFSPGDLDRAVLALVAEVVSGALERHRRNLLEADFLVERQRRDLAEKLADLQQSLLAAPAPQISQCFLDGLHGLVRFDRAALVRSQAEGCRILALRGFMAPLNPLVALPTLRGIFPSWVEVPVQWGDGDGVLMVGRHKPWEEDQQLLIRALAGLLSTVLHNARLSQRLAEMTSQ